MLNKWYIVKCATTELTDVQYVAIELTLGLKQFLNKLIRGRDALVSVLRESEDSDSDSVSVRVSCYKVHWLSGLPPEWEKMEDWHLDNWEVVEEIPIVALAHSQDELPDNYHTNMLLPFESEEDNEGILCLGSGEDPWIYFDMQTDSGIHIAETPPLSDEIVKWVLA